MNDVPVDYYAGIDMATGRRTDEAQRPELSFGSVEYVAPTEYMVRFSLSFKFSMAVLFGVSTQRDTSKVTAFAAFAAFEPGSSLVGFKLLHLKGVWLMPAFRAPLGDRPLAQNERHASVSELVLTLVAGATADAACVLLRHRCVCGGSVQRRVAGNASAQTQMQMSCVRQATICYQRCVGTRR